MSRQYHCTISDKLEAHLKKELPIYQRSITRPSPCIGLWRGGKIPREESQRLSSLTKAATIPKERDSVLINFGFNWGISYCEFSKELIEVLTQTEFKLYIYKQSAYLAEEINGKYIDFIDFNLQWD